MQIATDSTQRIYLEEGKDRRRKLLSLFYKYVSQDVTIIDTATFENLVKENTRLQTQLKIHNELRQADLDRQDIHRRV